MKYLMFLSGLLLLAIATIGNAYYHHKQYYPCLVYLARSNASVAITYFISSNLMWLFGYWLLRVFFGELRAAENEELWERLKYVATETLMAFAVYRDDFSPRFALLFAVLLYVKILHWLGEERIDCMERSPVVPKLFHIRMLSLLGLLGAADAIMIAISCSSVQMNGPSPHMAFGFEYALLVPTVFYIVLKYALHTAEIRREAPLEDKAMILIYCQIVFDFVKLVLYFSYLTVMFRLYLVPAFTFRQIFNTTKNFVSSVSDVISFQKAVRYMNKFCPTATEKELEQTDSICIVCREEMRTGAKKLHCNHIFHGSCLRSWFQRQQTCPTCRHKILSTIVKEKPREIENQQQQETGHQILKNTTALNISESNFHQSLPVNNQTLLQDIENDTLTHNLDEIDREQNLSHLNCPKQDTSLSYLSCQDLLEVEKDTREGIQNRIKRLQSVTKILDSTLVMMQQCCQEATAGSRTNALKMQKDIDNEMPSTSEKQEHSCESRSNDF